MEFLAVVLVAILAFFGMRCYISKNPCPMRRSKQD